MTHLPVTSDLRLLIKLQGRCASAIDAAWHRLVILATNPDLLAVVLFCVIGLGITINVLLRQPNLGLMTEQLQLFP
jgi:hypothetical protein